MTLAPLTRRALCALAFVGLTQTAMAQEAPRVKFVTNAGEFVVEVYPDKAPKTVDNFLQYVRDKHYDGTIFHRVIGNFMVQGGGYDQRYIERRTRPPVEHEGREALAKGGPRNTVGTIAMARTNDPNSADTQFFLMRQPRVGPDGLDQKYTVWGRALTGLDVIRGIKAGPLIAGHKPKGDAKTITSPHDRSVKLGSVIEADDKAIEAALASKLTFPGLMKSTHVSFSGCRTPGTGSPPGAATFSTITASAQDQRDGLRPLDDDDEGLCEPETCL